MKFRPLCINYHARAQQIIITERDYNSRRAAQSLLSHRHADDDHDRSNITGVLPHHDDEENRKPSNYSLRNDSDEDNGGNSVCDNQKYRLLDNSTFESNDHRNESSHHHPSSNVNAARSSTSTQGVLSIISLLGPAVHPSECALRSVTPLRRGPIRGRLLPIHNKKMHLTENIELHSNAGQEKSHKDTPLFLENDGSRHRKMSLFDDAAMFRQSGFFTGDHPMRILKSDDNGSSDDEAENTSKSSKNDAPTSLPLLTLLRHEPEDLTKIQSFKSIRILLSMTNFSSEIMTEIEDSRLCRNRSASTESRQLHQVRGVPTSLSSKPKLSMFSGESADRYIIDDFALNKNDLSLASFYEDCHGGLDDLGSAGCILKRHGEDPFFMIRLDPDFDPSLFQRSIVKDRPNDSNDEQTLRYLGEFRNAEYLLKELSLPSRFEHEHYHQICTSLGSRSIQKFEFVEIALNRFKESQLKEEAFLFSFDQSDLLMTVFPKKITLESDLSIYDDDDDIKPIINRQMTSALDLPLFAQSLPFSCARKVSTGRSKMQKRFVDSSARVCKIDALSNICGPSKVACLFLPQIKIQFAQNASLGSEEQRKLSASKDLVSFVRSSVPAYTIPESDDLGDVVDFLQVQGDAYPIFSWFAADGDVFGGSDIIDPIEVDEMALSLKQETFCSNSVRVGDEERSRCVLFTGCSSRMNTERLFSYRGFLTNQIVNPRVFQKRYRSMIEINKISQRENMFASNNCSDGAFGPRQSSFFFSRMVITEFSDSFAARMSKKKKGKKRGAPFASSLKTRKHRNYNDDDSRENLFPLTMKKALPFVRGQRFVMVPAIESLMSFFHQKEEIIANDDLERLWRDNLNVRGELLHLNTKAHELKEEEDACLAELAVINRGREETPNHVSFEDVICNKVDNAAECDATTYSKRKAGDDTAMEEYANEKKKRPKRKKEKKKKKKSHKRKRRDYDDHIDDVQAGTSSMKQLGGGCNPSSKCKGQLQSSSSEKKPRIYDEDESEPSTAQKSWKAVPSISLGITPIHCPTVKRSHTQFQPRVLSQNETPKTSENHDSLNTQPTNHKLSSCNDSPSGKSPDSVAAALSHGALFVEADNKVPTMQLQSPSENEFFGEQEGDNLSENGNGIDKSTESNYDDEKAEDKKATFTILTSESFLELFGETIMELASGRWFYTLTSVERLQIARVLDTNHQSAESGSDRGIPKQAKLNVCDCPLIDIAGADIELAGDKALIVQRVSTLSQSDSIGSNSGNKAFIRRIVLLAASGRYRSIHVILCVDTDMRPSDIVMLQNALIQQSGCPCENVSFEYTSPRTLSSSIALQFCNSNDAHQSSRISQFASDENVQERARFLICLVPTMTVHTALKCLGAESPSDRPEDDGGGEAMQKLMSLASNTTRALFPHKVTSLMPKACAEQLWFVINVKSSFASSH